MTAFIERMVQKITEAAPIETAMSGIVANVLENTTSKLERFEMRRQVPGDDVAEQADEAA